MNLELISTLASLTTAVIIGATAVAAMVQLRHMRSSNQINAQLAVRTMMNDVRKESDLLRNGLTAAMADPSFRRYIRAMARGETCAHTPEHQAFYNAAFTIVSTGATIGELTRRGIIDEDTLLAPNHERFWITWKAMENFVAVMREAGCSQNQWESWEYISARAMQWGQRRHDTYPKGVPRLHPKNPWAGEAEDAETPQQVV
jgi:hypothetical protein